MVISSSSTSSHPLDRVWNALWTKDVCRALITQNQGVQQVVCEKLSNLQFSGSECHTFHTNTSHGTTISADIELSAILPPASKDDADSTDHSSPDIKDKSQIGANNLSGTAITFPLSKLELARASLEVMEVAFIAGSSFGRSTTAKMRGRENTTSSGGKLFLIWMVGISSGEKEDSDPHQTMLFLDIVVDRKVARRKEELALKLMESYDIQFLEEVALARCFYNSSQSQDSTNQWMCAPKVFKNINRILPSDKTINSYLYGLSEEWFDVNGDTRAELLENQLKQCKSTTSLFGSIVKNKIITDAASPKSKNADENDDNNHSGVLGSPEPDAQTAFSTADTVSRSASPDLDSHSPELKRDSTSDENVKTIEKPTHISLSEEEQLAVYHTSPAFFQGRSGTSKFDFGICLSLF